MTRQPMKAQRGMTLVELMVALALGLFTVAVMLAFTTAHLRQNRDLLLEARLMHDLNAAADLVAHDLRRAGYWGQAERGVDAQVPQANPYADVSSSPGAVSFAFSRDATENGTVDVAEQFGFRLRNATIEIQLGAGNWQALTDDQTLRVATFTLSPQTDDVPLGGFCTKPCPPGLSTCPRQRLRRFVIDMSGVSALDTRVVRQLRTEVKLRNDAIEGACPA